MAHGKDYGQLIFDVPENLKNVARYIWSVFTEATQFRLSDFPENPFVIHTTSSFGISDSFDNFLSGKIQAVVQRYKLPEGLDDFRREEPLACAFYLINSLHETLLPPDKFDKYGRYPYQESIQCANNLMEINYVQDIFDEVYVKITGESPQNRISQLFWSHDIDYLYSAWKTELILAIRNQRYAKIPGIAWKAMTRPHQWDNVRQILDLENEYDIQSTFFWLTEQGKKIFTDTAYIDHADYNFHSSSLRHLWNGIEAAGSCNGLHKSAFDLSLDEEVRKLPKPVYLNRNHFLRLQLPGHYAQIEKSGLRCDATLGFAEHYGFRNSFGRPFQPYNLAKNRPFKLIEFPLHLMDATFLSYLHLDLKEMTHKMIQFINQHKHSSVISILLHNSQFNFRDDSEKKIWHQFYDLLQGFEVYVPEVNNIS